ncbi:S41 family peptidase [Pseudoalteromonas luteoviolacea]|uniref:Tail specific protease domain-containing protein n=1 Tax=Pseudoalteromonas luteoviolacea S4060-1 TaxID=1365257 RepID=A0A167LJC0_9GAMM|nr:S41 family peptidase [Pseudoalteromonas luteoviolacea]KZN64642.1 hypothetical protein N478_21850 [Pseudoalteromonas luteoviolacea S4060-1]
MTLTSGYPSILIATILLISGCQDNQDHRSDLQRSAGIWQKPAYGEALNITMNRVIRYEYNRYGCLQISEQAHLEQTAQLDSIALSQARRLRMENKGQVYPNYYEQLDALPSQCNHPLTISDSSAPSVIFEYFWHAFNDYYAFFSLRDVDWQAQYDLHRPQITDTMSDDELFDVLAEMVTPLQDMHVTISSPQQEFFTSKPTPILEAIQADADQLRTQGKANDLPSLFAQYQKKLQAISQHYIAPDTLNTQPQQRDNATAIWGKTTSNVGILVLNNMDDYATHSSADEQQHLKAAHEMMTRVIADLKDTEAMIIDVRHNTGGDDAISLAIASYFADRDVLAFNKQAINQAGRGIPMRQKLTANPFAYTQPVYLLTSQLTVSAAEVFTMAMDQFKQVTKVGEETAGALSDALRFTLPNGWRISLSNEVYRNAQGDAFEHIGFIPDHQVPAFSRHDLEAQRFETYDFVLNKLQKSSNNVIDIQGFENQVIALQSQGNIPNIAVNIIADGQSIYSQGFTTNNQQPIDADTPFYLASLDEVFIGATIATASLEKRLDLDESIYPLLPFSIDYPEENSSELTLTQLLTHRSGIIDNPAVLSCSASDTGLSRALVLPCTNTSVTREEFLQAYLTSAGKLYHLRNFSTHYGVTPGELSTYSHVGVELATFVLEQSHQESIAALTQRYVFEPLNMHNTYWQATQKTESVKGKLISTANDLSHYLKMRLAQNEAAQLPMANYFWRVDNQKSYHRGQGSASKSHLFADYYNKTGYVLLTDTNTESQEAVQAYQDLERLVFKMALHLSHRSQNPH